MDGSNQGMEVQQNQNGEFTEMVATYMQQCFLEEVCKETRALPDLSLPFPMVCEADHIIAIIVAAYNNQGKPYNIGYTAADPQASNLSLSFSEVTSPMLFIDSYGGIILWYLPGAISKANQIAIWKSITQLRAPLMQSIKQYRTCSWQNDTNYFHESTNLKGTINLSPVWFQQGHGPPKHCPEVSHLLKTRTGAEGLCGWLADMTSIHALLSRTLMVIHPWMYDTSKQVLAHLAMKANNEANINMVSALSIWNTVYSSMSIMVNCATPYHMDANGWKPWLDMLLTVGEYKLLNFIIPTLDLQLCYNTGTYVQLFAAFNVHEAIYRILRGPAAQGYISLKDAVRVRPSPRPKRVPESQDYLIRQVQ
ncbi:hypothetical protein EDC04DRAFT_2597987 [Pisolithus marmoratus]|nr:hypothetical protein EDC04DRAFT_2597987 [Pisolithus marmoratus]